MLKILMYGKSDKGLIRKINQDNFFSNEKMRLGIVADGIGGRKAGEVASQFAVDVIAHEFTKYDKQDLELREFMTKVAKKTNSEILSHGQQNKKCEGMATTLECVYFQNDMIHIGHIGDSRTYLYFEKNLWQLTIDHNVGNYRKLGIDGGAVKLNFSNDKALTRALGLMEYFDLDIYNKIIKPGEIYFSASDGLFDMVDNKTIVDVIDRYKHDLRILCEILIHEANKNGGRDNITIVVYKVVDDNGK